MFKREDWVTTMPKDKYGDNVYRFETGKAVSYFIGLVVLLTFLLGSWGVVSPGERGVRVRLGVIKKIVEPGFYFKIPVIEAVHIMEVKTRTINYDKSGDTGDTKDSVDNLFGASRDLQDVAIGVIVNYHISPSKVDAIYAQYRSVENYEVNVIEPLIREIVKSTSAQYTAEELVTKRAEFGDKVNLILVERFNSKDSILERFSVTNFEFSTAFTQAIEAKVTAVQNAEAAKNKLEQIKFEAQQTIESAKAQAEAISIQAQAINSTGGKDYVALQWVRAWQEGGSQVPQIITGGSGNNFLLDIGGLK